MAKVKANISDAKRILGLRHKVYIDHVPHQKLQLSSKTLQQSYFARCAPDTIIGDHGFYRDFRFTQPYHVIRLTQDRNLIALTTTLGHELIHAQQAECFQDPKNWHKYLLSHIKAFSYWSDPIEVEARERGPEIGDLIVWI